MQCYGPAVRTIALLIPVFLLSACPTGADPGPNPDPDLEPCDFLAQPPDLALEDVAAEAGVQELVVNMGIGAEDWDGDGDVDALLAGAQPPTPMFINAGDGTFDVMPDPPRTSQGTGVASPDFDGDGDPDLYLSCGQWTFGCSNKLFRNDGVDGDGWPLFVDVTNQVGLEDDAPSNFGGTWADYDLDGDLDLFQATKAIGGGAPPEDLLYRNDDGVFVEVGAQAGLDTPTHSHMGGWLDYDEDGWADLYVPTLDGPNHLFHNAGDGTFVEVTTPALAEPMSAFGVIPADFDNDGHIDLLVNGRHDEQIGLIEDHGLFLGDGAGGWTDASFTTGLNDPGDPSTHIETMGFQSADLDLDGYLEVIFGAGDPDAGAVNGLGSFRPDGQGGVTWLDRTDLIDVAPEQDGLPDYPYRTHGMAVFDHDGDGLPDLMMGNGGGNFSGPVRLWRNTTPDPGAWVRIRLVGTSSNPDGVGARIRIADGPEGASTWAVHRFNWPTTGFNSSRPRTLRIGTGRCVGPHHVTVTWPDGSLQEVDGVQVGELTTVVEDAG